MDSISKNIISEFLPLCRIPRGSENEQAVSEYYMERLRSMGLSPVRDESLNIMCDVPASPGMESAPLIMLQAHMDMVTASAPGSGYNPLSDPVNCVVDEAAGTLHTDGRSSLGADNGIGGAAILWAAQQPDHGPLRLLYTAKEEIGLQGAEALSPGWFNDARYLINTDGFHSDTVTLGCAGGKRETYTKKPDLRPLPEACTAAFEISLTDFPGGHSGDDIGLGRLNPVSELAGLLLRLEKRLGVFAVSLIEGGSAHNAIPMWSRAVIAADDEEIPALLAALGELKASVTAAGPLGGNVSIVPAELPETVFADNSPVSFLAGLETGVISMSPYFKGCVSASSNLGRVFYDGGNLCVWCMTRCDDPADEKRILNKRFADAASLGFSASASGYPAWQYMGENELTDAVKSLAKSECGTDLKLTVCHVGLEPAFFSRLAPELKIISIGPDIEGAHSVSETVYIDSVSRFGRLLMALLRHFSG